jgi:NADH-quinone oxidoreductase subunit C
MTLALSGSETANKLKGSSLGGIAEAGQNSLLVKSESLLDIATYLKTAPGLELDYLNYITAVDYKDYFELVYQLTSLKYNHSLVVRTRCFDRESPSVPSVTSLWRGADFQEREIFDLMGIRFDGHPNMKRIFLWEGFEGYPLRKDFSHGA